MEKLKEAAVEVIQSLLSLVRSTKAAYEGSTRFARMRLWILVVLAVDVLVVIWFMTTFGSKDIDVAVWFKQSFPSNMLFVRNDSGEVLEGVRLQLDNTYSLTVPKLAEGASGFEIGREFLDRAELTPDDDYIPRVVKIEVDGDTMQLKIEPDSR